jgi:uroporphyrin-III C-methyltransferase/precorrin-2 dehydrogenase/sirohydrochlorin ferrochelatase
MTLAALPLFVKLAGRPVMLIGSGDAAEAKRRLLERAGARIEALLPAKLGELAWGLNLAKGRMRERWGDTGLRREAIGAALAEGGALDPLREHDAEAVGLWLAVAEPPAPQLIRIVLSSGDPDDLSLRQARALAAAARIYHRADVPEAILNRARADALRIPCSAAPADPGDNPGGGLSIDLEMLG